MVALIPRGRRKSRARLPTTVARLLGEHVDPQLPVRCVVEGALLELGDLAVELGDHA